MLVRMGGKKRCRGVCRRWFIPDPRVREWQQTCGEAECRAAYQRRKQARWRARNRGYAVDWRLGKKIEQAAAAEKARAEAQQAGTQPLPPEAQVAPAVPPGPAILAAVPWDIAKTVMGVQGAVLLGHLAQVSVRVAKTEMRAYRAEIAAEFDRVRAEVAKTVIPPGLALCERPP